MYSIEYFEKEEICFNHDAKDKFKNVKKIDLQENIAFICISKLQKRTHPEICRGVDP